MAWLSLPPVTPTLSDHFFGRSLGAHLVLITAGAALTSLAAQLTIPMWPVPLTGQTVAVLVVGSTLGAIRGTLSMLLYVVAGAAGLPVFNNGSAGLDSISGPTGGYILGFVAGAAFAGGMAQRGLDRRFFRASAIAAAGTVIIHAVGVPWLAVVTGSSVADAFVAGSLPIAFGAVIKALVVGWIIAALWRGIRSPRRLAEPTLGDEWA